MTEISLSESTVQTAISVRQDIEPLECSNHMLDDDLLAANAAVSSPVFLGERIFLAPLLWMLTVGMQALYALVACVGLPALRAAHLCGTAVCLC